MKYISDYISDSPYARKTSRVTMHELEQPAATLTTSLHELEQPAATLFP